MKLHLGCGPQRYPNCINADIRITNAIDLVCDARQLPFADSILESIESYHLIEHLPWREVPAMLMEWHRVLLPNGLLIIECPDFDEAVRQYLKGNKARIYNIFGLQRWEGDAHLFGYNYDRLAKLLHDAEFRDVREEEPIEDHKWNEPCLRIVGVK